MKKLLLASGLLLVTGYAVLRLTQREGYPAHIPNRTLTSAEKFVASAEKVQVVRIEDTPFAASQPGNLDRYKKLRSVTWESGSSLQNAKALVIRAAGEDSPNLACAAIPAVGLRFWKGRQHQDIIFCFKCMQWIWSANGRPWETIGPSAAQLLEVAIEAFPDDRALRGQRGEARKMSNSTYG